MMWRSMASVFLRFTSCSAYLSWHLHSGLNCYNGHGAAEYDNLEPYELRTANIQEGNNMSLSECKALCENTNALGHSACTAVTVQRVPGGVRCWRHTSVVTDECKADPNYDTWIATGTIVPYSP